MSCFRLVHVSGEDLGLQQFAGPGWWPGDTIPLRGRSLRVVKVIWHDEDEQIAGTLTVELADQQGAWTVEAAS